MAEEQGVGEEGLSSTWEPRHGGDKKRSWRGPGPPAPTQLPQAGRPESPMPPFLLKGLLLHSCLH